MQCCVSLIIPLQGTDCLSGRRRINTLADLRRIRGWQPKYMDEIKQVLEKWGLELLSDPVAIGTDDTTGTNLGVIDSHYYDWEDLLSCRKLGFFAMI